jgi:RimJ/RimL family protein N-acetyltransferase
LDDEARAAQGYDDAAVAASAASVPYLAAHTYGGCPLAFAVTRPGLADVLGFYVIEQDPQDPDIPTLGWWLKASGRGQGLGRESLALVLVYVHRHLRLPFVRMGTAVDNRQARAQIEAVGGYEACRGSRQLPNGQAVVAVWYEHEG